MACGCAATNTKRNSVAQIQSVKTHAAPLATSIDIPPADDDSGLEIESSEHQAAAPPPDLPFSISIELTPPPPLPIAEPSATALVQAITDHLTDRMRESAGEVRISMSQLRNQSRAGAMEFQQFRIRIADALNVAARNLGNSIAFTCDADETTDYQLRGTAYLITDGGEDQWELFLNLSPALQDWSIWQADRPVRMLRQDRDGRQWIVDW